MANIEILGPIHNSHLTAIRRCKQKFKYAFIEGIQAKIPGLPLARGIWLHYCLEAQFLRWGIDEGTLLYCPERINVDGVGPVVVDSDKLLLGVQLNEEFDFDTYPLSAAGMLQLLTDHVWSRLMEAEQEKYTEAGHNLPDACERILTEYFYYWKNEPKPEVLLIEVDWKRDFQGVTFEGRADYVIRRGNRLICGDWKSTKREPHPRWKFMESQLYLYPWGLAPKLEELGVDADSIEKMSVEFDYLSTVLPTTPSINKDGSLSKRKINTTYLTLVNFLKANDLKWTRTEAEEYLLKTERVFFRREQLPRNKKVMTKLLLENKADTELMAEVVADDNRVTRTVTKECDWDCDFIDLCMAELYGQNSSYIRKTQFEKRTNSHAGVVTDDDD